MLRFRKILHHSSYRTNGLLSKLMKLVDIQIAAKVNFHLLQLLFILNSLNKGFIMKPLLATGVKTCVINVLFEVELKVLENIRIIWTRKIYLYKMPFLIKIFNTTFIRWNAITWTMNKNSLEIISGIFPFTPLSLYDKKNNKVKMHLKSRIYVSRKISCQYYKMNKNKCQYFSIWLSYILCDSAFQSPLIESFPLVNHDTVNAFRKNLPPLSYTTHALLEKLMKLFHS